MTTTRRKTPALPSAEERRRILFAPITRGVLATTTYGQPRGGGAACGENAGPRDVVLGRNGHIVGWRRKQTERG